MTTSVIRPGEVHARLALSDGQTAILRGPNWNDLDDLTDYINGLVAEGAQITKTEPISREAEAEWLGQRFSEIENERMIMLVAEVYGKVVAVGEVGPLTGERGHTGYLGIGVSKEKRGKGLGESLMRALLKLAKRADLKIVFLDAFATNKAAIGLYEKLGFKEIGRIPKGLFRQGNYIDLVRMAVEI